MNQPKPLIQYRFSSTMAAGLTIAEVDFPPFLSGFRNIGWGVFYERISS
ncbi:hypothetical protein [Pseudogulbenkiania ferrooxidans]|nr:hypothetical protein [Pseudogulbenkiania ferrooxidans]